MSVRITLLGGFSADVGHGPVDPSAWRRRHAAALVKVLALAPGRRLHREQLMDMLWPELSRRARPRPGCTRPRTTPAGRWATRRRWSWPGRWSRCSPIGDVQVDAVEFETAAPRRRCGRGIRPPAGRAADRYAR